MNLFLSQIVFNLRSGHVRADLADAYSLHRRIMSCFPDLGEKTPDARKRFGVLHRIEMTRDPFDLERRISVLIQSSHTPDFVRLPPSYALGEPHIKPFSPAFHAGQVLRFRLHANPTRRLSRASKDKQGNPVTAGDVGKRVPIRESDQRAQWLNKRGQFPSPAFSVLELHPTWGRSNEPAPSTFQLFDADLEIVHGDKPGCPITLEGVLFEGCLRVEDSDAMAQRVAVGIGTGKAFGFGLLSLARP